MDCVKEVLGRAWFERMWTMQELLLSQKAIVVCGPTLLAWERLVAFGERHREILGDHAELAPFIRCFEAWALYKKQENLLDVEGKEDRKYIKDSIQRDLMMATWSISEKEVAHILQSARVRKAGDFRDKVFALFSIIHNVKRRARHFRSLITRNLSLKSTRTLQ
jgi:hypothetical protein